MGNCLHTLGILYPQNVIIYKFSTNYLCRIYNKFAILKKYLY